MVPKKSSGPIHQGYFNSVPPLRVYHFMNFKQHLNRQYHLNISENKSIIEIYKGRDINLYAELSHIQIKQSNDFYTINDIITNGQKLVSESINILGAIKQVTNITLLYYTRIFVMNK